MAVFRRAYEENLEAYIPQKIHWNRPVNDFPWYKNEGIASSEYHITTKRSHAPNISFIRNPISLNEEKYQQ